MKLLDLPQFKRFRDDRNVKVLRHKDSRQDLWELRRRDKAFERYQNGQGWDVFGRAKHIVSFIAEGNRFAKFVGVWKVDLTRKRRTKIKGFRYQTTELSGFEDLEGRLIIDWGESPRSWAQCLDRKGNKDVVEILSPHSLRDFHDYYDVHLSYAELQELITHPDSNRKWHQMLCAVSGIYLILDQRSGKQYVGSAYGKEGIWGRWRAYTKSPSGGNKLLKELIKKHPGRENFFHFSIMRVLEPNITKAAVLAHEKLAKKKLGIREFGLCAN